MLPNPFTKRKSKIIVNPIGSKNLMFRRITNRYATKGTLSSNRGYLRISRDATTGRFAPRPA